MGLAILGIDAWIYYLRGIRHVSVDANGRYHFNGPVRAITVAPMDIQSVSYWWMDSYAVAPRYVRTGNGNFFLPPGLQGPSDLFEHIQAGNPLIELRRVPL
jgi:hypothetical protein